MNSRFEVPDVGPGAHQANPYAPPEAPVDRAPPQRPAARKPIAAWLLQLLAVVVGGLSALGIWRLTAYLVQNPQIEAGGMLLFFDFAWRLGLVASAVGALIGTQRRTAYGRWLGLLLLAAAVVLLAYLKLGLPFMSTRNSYWRLAPSSTSVDNSAEAAGIVLLFGLMAWWVYAFGFSAKARKFFRVTPRVESTGPR